MIGYPEYDCRMFQTEGWKTVHFALEKCRQNNTKELSLECSENKEKVERWLTL